ncbi:potassium/proton antiporter [Fuerstiella marisgermanici]|uniref:Potassium/proton antiporter n=1 Tax=Fuerstiella marisgermanici TaxID=1891926 RepID=A0A1P8WBC1_9PLAN|nr:potassium/proton antiporter [Fuerstiella marisgermanici]
MRRIKSPRNPKTSFLYCERYDVTESEKILVALSGIFVLGIGSQWVASRLKVPSILLLLLTGILAGPVFNLVNPGQLLGDLLLPLVSLCVGIVLFEGSLSLRIKDLRQIGRPLIMLLTVGVLITWVTCTLAAWWILDFNVSLALLIGAILTVTGPTVVGPMLQHIRPIGQAGPIARWEGIVVDPIGAVLAVLVFSVYRPVQNADFDGAAWTATVGFLKTMFAGSAIGVAAALLLIVMLRRHWITDHLQSSFTLMIVVAAFTCANLIKHESGLVTVTVMGVILANQHVASMRHIIEFKENLSVLLISSLFILLSARLELRQFEKLGWRGPAFVAFVILVSRPLSVMVSTIGAGLKIQERLFLSWLAPRGIVAAAVASVFALELAGEDKLVAATFLVIIGTVITYGSTAAWAARKLGLSVADPQGVLIGSAHPASRAIAVALQEAGVTVRLVDRNPQHLSMARMEGLSTFYGDMLSDSMHEELDISGIGRFLSMTPNDEVNSLAASHFTERFGRSNVYRLSAPPERSKRREKSAEVLKGRVLFSNEATYHYLDQRFEAGAIMKATPLTDEFGYEEFRDRYGDAALVMFVLEGDQVTVVSTDLEPVFRPGQTLIALVDH